VFLAPNSRSANWIVYWPHLRAAAEHYDEEVDALQDLRELFDAGHTDTERGAVLLSKALEHERAALAQLQRALAAS